MPKERILYIDRLRGVNILLVVMGHVITNNVIDSSANKLLVWGATFRMPLFMFLCGYIAYKIITPSIFINYTNFLLKKARTLLLPFFVWPLLVKPFFFSQNNSVDVLAVLQKIISGGGLWFLWYLFWITLIYSLWLYVTSRVKISQKSYWDLLVLGIMLLLLVEVWIFFRNAAFKQFIFYLCFYFFGVFTAKYKGLTRLLCNTKVFTVAMLLFVLLVDRYQYGASFLLNTVVRLTCAISGIIICYFIIRNIQFSKIIDRYIRKWGVASLAIYVTHSFTVSLLGRPFISNDINICYMFLVTGSITLISTMICMQLYQLVCKSSLLGTLLYGKKLINTKWVSI